MASLSAPHIVIFPFMAHSHTLPLLDLAKALSRQKVKVTIITIPSNAKTIAPRIAGFPLLSLAELPFPSVDGLPKGCETLSEIPSTHFFLSFITATRHLQKPFEQLLQSMKDSADLPLCVISDFFLCWTLGICQQFGVPRLVFHATGVLSMLISQAILVKTDYVNSSSISNPLDQLLPKLPFSLTVADLPDVNISTKTTSNAFTDFMAQAGEDEVKSWGIVLNTFLELESDYVSAFESFYTSGTKTWCLGPTFLYGKMDASDVKIGDHQDEHSASLMNWLDMRAIERPQSVIYVAFGTQAVVSDTQLDELALGLEESGCPFVLVVRSNSWSPPNGMEERVKTRGLIARRFVDQTEVLFHSATGGFLSHCGWNSVMESMAASVPILAWPMMAEQKLNAKYIVDGLGFGVSLEGGNTMGSGTVVSREKFSACVKELMQGEKGRKARDRAEELGRLARQAVEDGGSSDVTLKNLIQTLSACRLEKCVESSPV